MLQEQHINEIQNIVSLGFSNVKRETLKALYKKVYGVDIKQDCGACWNDAFVKLKRLLETQKISSHKAKFMSYRIKEAFIKQKFAFTHKGRKHIVSAHNATDESLQILASIPKYSHCVEQIGGNVSKQNVEEHTGLRIVKKAGGRKSIKDAVDQVETEEQKPKKVKRGNKGPKK